MIDLRRTGRRICGALLLLWAGMMPLAAQDLRLPLQQGQPDLALFALSRSEDRISGPGNFLLARQGFYHRPGGPVFQGLTAGRHLTPTFRHDPNINDGIPSDRITLGGLPFVVDRDSRARDAVLAGVQFTRWQSWSYAPGARLRLTQAVAAELEPVHGHHQASAHLRVCAEQPVAGWTWADSCLAAGAVHDGGETDTALSLSVGTRHLFESAAGVHQAGLTLGTTATGGYVKEVVQLSHVLVTERAGMWSLGYTWGEVIPGENTLRRRLSLDWTGEVARRIVGLSLSETRTGGSALFGVARADRKIRAGLTVPVGQVDLGAWVERSQSTIDAWRGTDIGMTIGFRMNLL